MIDGSLSITDSAVRQFTEKYLDSVGCEIDSGEDLWQVTIPDTAATELGSGTLSLATSEDIIEQEETIHLHPESGFFQELLTEACARRPVGKFGIEAKDAEIEIPIWIQKSEASVAKVQFTPYYDRTALVFLFKISIETVSEYEREILRPIAVDTRSGDELPKLEASYLRLTSLDGSVPTTNLIEIEEQKIEEVLENAQSYVETRIEPELDEVHQEASRAADAEIEEYRQLQQQHLEELEEKQERLSEKIEDLNEDIDTGDQEKRVAALKERKQLNAEYEEIADEISDVRERRDKGFPVKQREIRERHALSVDIQPITATEVEYERGEVEFELIRMDNTKSLTLGYGSGVGVTDEVACSSCDQRFDQSRLIQKIQPNLTCEDCGGQ